MGEPIRVVTINTAKGDQPYEARIRWMANQLAELQPAIVACQEVFVSREARADTGRTLARELGMELAYTPARRKARPWNDIEVQSESGMALLSVAPLSQLETLHLPSDRRDGERIAQVGVLEFDKLRLVVANVHLTHLRDADELRCRQLRTVLAHPLLADAAATRLVCGDFNTTTDGPVFCKMPALLDCWEHGEGSGPRGTLVGAGPPGPCVDHIFALGPNGAVRFQNSRVTLDGRDPCSGAMASDHLAVVTEIVLSSGGPA